MCPAHTPCLPPPRGPGGRRGAPGRADPAPGGDPRAAPAGAAATRRVRRSSERTPACAADHPAGSRPYLLHFILQVHGGACLAVRQPARTSLRSRAPRRSNFRCPAAVAAAEQRPRGSQSPPPAAGPAANPRRPPGPARPRPA